MTIAAGYVDSDPGTMRIFNCTPKGGIWFNSSVPPDTTQGDLFGSGGSPGVFSLSFGFNSAITREEAQAGSRNGGSGFNSAGSAITTFLTGGPTGFDNRDLNRILSFSSQLCGWTVTTNLNNGIRGYYLSLWGDTMQVFVGTFVLPTSGATLNVTGCGFDPDLVLFAGADQGTVGAVMQIGALDTSGNQWAQAASISEIHVGIGDTEAYGCKLDRCLYAPSITSFAGAVGHSATGTIISDGFSLAISTNPPSSGATYAFMAIKDPSGGFRVGSGDMSGGASGLAFRPEAVLFATTWATDQSPHPTNGISHGFIAAPSGLGEPTLNQTSCFSENDLTLFGAPGKRWRSNSESHSLVQTNSSGTVTKSMDATITDDGFTVSASDSSRLYGWVAMKGSDQIVDCAPCETFTPQIYRRIFG